MLVIFSRARSPGSKDKEPSGDARMRVRSRRETRETRSRNETWVAPEEDRGFPRLLIELRLSLRLLHIVECQRRVEFREGCRAGRLFVPVFWNGVRQSLYASLWSFVVQGGHSKRCWTHGNRVYIARFPWYYKQLRRSHLDPLIVEIVTLLCVSFVFLITR